MQTETSLQAPPAPPRAMTVTTTGPGGPQIIQTPLTRSGIAELRDRREELSNQLISAAGRRKKLSGEIVGTDGANRDGLQARIDVLDKRIIQLESDLAETGRQLTHAPRDFVSGGKVDDNFVVGPGGVTLSGGAFTLLILAPLAYVLARRIFRKKAMGTSAPVSVEQANRLVRLEQSVDAIAIEIERISEGQRFVTRLLSEQQPRQIVGEKSGAIAVGNG